MSTAEQTPLGQQSHPDMRSFIEGAVEKYGYGTAHDGVIPEDRAEMVQAVLDSVVGVGEADELGEHDSYIDPVTNEPIDKADVEELRIMLKAAAERSDGSSMPEEVRAEAEPESAPPAPETAAKNPDYRVTSTGGHDLDRIRKARENRAAAKAAKAKASESDANEDDAEEEFPAGDSKIDETIPNDPEILKRVWEASNEARRRASARNAAKKQMTSDELAREAHEHVRSSRISRGAGELDNADYESSKADDPAAENETGSEQPQKVWTSSSEGYDSGEKAGGDAEHEETTEEMAERLGVPLSSLLSRLDEQRAREGKTSDTSDSPESTTTDGGGATAVEEAPVRPQTKIDRRGGKSGGKKQSDTETRPDEQAEEVDTPVDESSVEEVLRNLRGGGYMSPEAAKIITAANRHLDNAETNGQASSMSPESVAAVRSLAGEAEGIASVFREVDDTPTPEQQAVDAEREQAGESGFASLFEETRRAQEEAFQQPPVAPTPIPVPAPPAQPVEPELIPDAESEAVATPDAPDEAEHSADPDGLEGEADEAEPATPAVTQLPAFRMTFQHRDGTTEERVVESRTVADNGQLEQGAGPESVESDQNTETNTGDELSDNQEQSAEDDDEQVADDNENDTTDEESAEELNRRQRWARAIKSLGSKSLDGAGIAKNRVSIYFTKFDDEGNAEGMDKGKVVAAAALGAIAVGVVFAVAQKYGFVMSVGSGGGTHGGVTEGLAQAAPKGNAPTPVEVQPPVGGGSAAGHSDKLTKSSVWRQIQDTYHLNNSSDSRETADILQRTRDLNKGVDLDNMQRNQSFTMADRMPNGPASDVAGQAAQGIPKPSAEQLQNYQTLSRGGINTAGEAVERALRDRNIKLTPTQFNLVVDQSLKYDAAIHRSLGEPYFSPNNMPDGYHFYMMQAQLDEILRNLNAAD